MTNLSFDYQAVRGEILELYGVEPSETFDVGAACAARIEYLKRFLRRTNRKGIVLGISGGVDSTAAGKLAQLACQELRDEGYQAHFYAVRLPAGTQFDESDAQDVLHFISPDKTLTINIGETSNALNDACLAAIENEGTHLSLQQADYHKGNVKARQRMAAQYYLAAAYEAVVLGTDHSAEAVPAFFTRGGDEIADLLVLNGLNKRQVRLCAKHMGAPRHLWEKPPTADLEELSPGKLDEESFGFPYDALDDFLEGKKIDEKFELMIIEKYEATRYRRLPPVGFSG